MDESRHFEHTAEDQRSWNIKWWEWRYQEHIQLLRASHATGLTGSRQVNLSSDPISSQPFLLPKPTSHRAESTWNFPPSPMQLPTDFQPTPNSPGQYQQIHCPGFAFLSSIHPSLFCHSWGKYRHLCAVQLLEEQIGNKIDDSKATAPNISPFKMYQNYFAWLSYLYTGINITNLSACCPLRYDDDKSFGNAKYQYH